MAESRRYAVPLVVIVAISCAFFAIRRIQHPRDYRALCNAVHLGDAREARAILASGLDAKASCYGGLLVMAMRYPHAELVPELIEHGADPNDQSMGGIPLAAAARNNRLDLIALLLRAGARVDEVGEGGTALEVAVKNCSADAARALLAAGAKKFDLGHPSAMEYVQGNTWVDACRRCPEVVDSAITGKGCKSPELYQADIHL